VHILTFDQTEFVDAFVPNHHSMLLVYIQPQVEGFNCCILLFIEKEVVQRLDLPFRKIEIIFRNLISPKPTAIADISFFLVLQTLLKYRLFTFFFYSKVSSLE
jgi:hypothetical protein